MSPRPGKSENHDTVEAVLGILHKILDTAEKRAYSPYFIRRCRMFTDRGRLSKDIRFIDYLFRLGNTDISGKRILDVGCKFGLKSLIMTQMGAKEVYALDCNRDYISNLQMYLAELDADFPLYPVLGDAGNLGYAGSSFDVVVAIESVSHFNDHRSFLSEAHMVLRNSGVLLISDGNNAANPVIRQRAYKIWDAFENGPSTDDIYGHSVERPYVEVRKDIIREECPGLRDTEIDRLAKATSGMWGKEIIAVCNRFINNGAEPSMLDRVRACPVDPDYGSRIEFLIDPFRIKNELQVAGFVAKVFAHFGGSRGALISGLNSVLRAFTPVTIFVAPALKVVGWKQ